MSKTDIVNRALSLYEFVESELSEGAQLIIRQDGQDYLVSYCDADPGPHRRLRVLPAPAYPEQHQRVTPCVAPGDARPGRAVRGRPRANERAGSRGAGRGQGNTRPGPFGPIGVRTE